MNHYWKRVQEMASALGLNREDLREYSIKHQATRHTSIFRDELGLVITSISMMDSHTFEADFEEDFRKCIRALQAYASWK